LLNQDRYSRIYQSRLEKSILRESSKGAKHRRNRYGKKSEDLKEDGKIMQPAGKASGSVQKLKDASNLNESTELIRMDKAHRYEEEKQKVIDDQLCLDRTQR
jgi:hypothetical protein